MHREVEDNTVIFTAFNRKLLRDLGELRNLLVRNKPERVMKKLNELIEDTKRDITESFVLSETPAHHIANDHIYFLPKASINQPAHNIEYFFFKHSIVHTLFLKSLVPYTSSFSLNLHVTCCQRLFDFLFHKRECFFREPFPMPDRFQIHEYLSELLIFAKNTISFIREKFFDST